MNDDLWDILDILEEIIVRNEITKNSNVGQISKQFSSAKDHEKHHKKHRERGSWGRNGGFGVVNYETSCRENANRVEM